MRVLDGQVVSVESGTGRVTVETTTGDAIAAEVKRRIVASKARSRSPTPDHLPQEEEAKRIMDKIRPNGDSPKAPAPQSPKPPEAQATPEATSESAEKPAEEVKSMETATAEIIAKAARVVSSLSDEEFSIRFNPDAFCPTVNHAEDTEDLEKQRKLVKEAAHFLLVTQIPNLVRDCLDHSLTPVDGAGLAEAMHARGINIRYLGKITEFIWDIPQLSYLKVMCLAELVCRSGKHVFRGWLQGVEAPATASAVAHFLNCLLGSLPSPTPPANVFSADDLGRGGKAGKAARRRGKAPASASTETDAAQPWTALTPRTLWEQITADVHNYYGFTLTWHAPLTPEPD